MNYAQKNDLFFPLFTKVVVNKSQAYWYDAFIKKYNFQL